MANVYLGCPLWAHAPWKGRFFTAKASREDFLPQYARVFGTTEGNATFYGLPAPETVERWAAEAPADFRFCFKFPRVISHEKALVGAEAETKAFFERLAPLGHRLGPFFLQLHESFGADRLTGLERYLDALPKAWTYALEVRAPEFFAEGPAEARLDALLTERGVNRVIFDTRALFASSATDSATLDAKRKKPRVPVRRVATGRCPFVRFVGDPHLETNDPLLQEWARTAARWMAEGRTPYLFTHHPDDHFAPDLARQLHRWLHEASPTRVPPPAPWPVESERPPATQLQLF